MIEKVRNTPQQDQDALDAADAMEATCDELEEQS